MRILINKTTTRMISNGPDNRHVQTLFSVDDIPTIVEVLFAKLWSNRTSIPTTFTRFWSSRNSILKERKMKETEENRGK